MLQYVRFARYPAPPELADLVDWFWSVSWDLPAGYVHRQQVLAQPSVNISVGNPPPPGDDPPVTEPALRSVVNGVFTDRSTRALQGRGWNLAAKTTTGGFGAWVDDVKALNDRVLPIGDVLGVDGDRLARSCAAISVADAAHLLGATLTERLANRDPERVDMAGQIARVARIAETDRSIRRVGDLAEFATMTPRTLQRAFASYVGVSPTSVIRRFRLLDAAELVRDGADVDWSDVAASLGYADQAHLIRDFTATLGQSPGAYVRACQSTT